MRTTAKSFLGAIAGTLLVLLVYTLVMKPNQKNDSGKTALAIEKVQPKTPVHQASFFAPQNTDFTEAAQKSVNAVVHIKTIIGIKPRHYDDFFGQLRDYLYGQQHPNRALVAFGSGVIISPDGYIVTNNHVVAGADKITVTFNDKRQMTAKVIGTSPSTDLAVIKVDAKDLPYLTYGNSDHLKVGQWVLAVGNPFNLTSTVTAGIVSAKARDIHILGGKTAIESFIQTDAAVNPGNSGGALVNTEGQLVGINAAIASQTGAYEGYSFAIPVNLVKKVVNDLIKYGQIQRAYLGIQIRNIDEELAKDKNLKNMEGVYVAQVMHPGGAAEAGMKAGDVITAVNNKPVKGLAAFMGIIGQYSPGNVVKVTVERDNRSKTFNVKLRNRNGSLALVKASSPFFNDKLGAELENITDGTMSQLDINHGLRITRVTDGILKNGGISKGFIITEVNNKRVSSKKSLEAALEISKHQHNIVRMKGMYPNGMRISFEFML